LLNFNLFKKLTTSISILIVKVSILALPCLINDTHLKELIDGFKHEFLGVEVVVMSAHLFVDGFKVNTSFLLSHDRLNEVLKFLLLFSDLQLILLHCICHVVDEAV
jgi:hypothetical protein